ncbi:MAG: iron complex transport system ATP-binding protein [Parvicella sp.]|jgi:iron complex transport system ATP-binding protein
MTKPILQILDLSIGYSKDKPLLNEINLTLESGSFTGIFGANGSGKSTLVKTASNSLPPLSGAVKLLDKGLSDYSDKEVAKHIAYIPSSSSYASGITVYDLLSFARIPYLGWSQKLSTTDNQLIISSSERIGVGSLLKMRFHELSEGQKQLVNITKALVQETQIIILDEPTAHLDIVNKIKVFEMLKNLSEEGKTILCISHDIHNIHPFLDQVAVITKDHDFKVYQSQEKQTEALLELLF